MKGDCVLTLSLLGILLCISTLSAQNPQEQNPDHRLRGRQRCEGPNCQQQHRRRPPRRRQPFHGRDPNHAEGRLDPLDREANHLERGRHRSQNSLDRRRQRRPHNNERGRSDPFGPFDNREPDLPNNLDNRGRDLHDTFGNRGRDLPNTLDNRGRGLPNFDNRGRDLHNTFENRGRESPNAFDNMERGLPNAFDNRERGLPTTFDNRGQDLPNAFNNRGQDLPNTFDNRGQNALFDNTGPLETGSQPQPSLFQSGLPQLPFPSVNSVQQQPNVGQGATSVMMQPTSAKCVFSSSYATNSINGIITFEPSPFGYVRISGSVRGLTPNTLLGFHVHEYGDLSNGCTSAGGHFNPYNKQHGAPTDQERHVGDLGNIQVSSMGEATVQQADNLISLNPGAATSIVGRALVIHAGPDDLGRGLHPTSKTTGNAGARLACCIIGVSRF